MSLIHYAFFVSYILTLPLLAHAVQYWLYWIPVEPQHRLSFRESLRYTISYCIVLGGLSVFLIPMYNHML
jgi:hypothetical protein